MHAAKSGADAPLTVRWRATARTPVLCRMAQSDVNEASEHHKRSDAFLLRASSCNSLWWTSSFSALLFQRFSAAGADTSMMLIWLPVTSTWSPPTTRLLLQGGSALLEVFARLWSRGAHDSIQLRLLGVKGGRGLWRQFRQGKGDGGWNLRHRCLAADVLVLAPMLLLTGAGA
eukprot:4650914-Prymnesium_polylepis.1